MKFVFHDAFHWDPDVWNDLFDDEDAEGVVLDTHQYSAWNDRNVLKGYKQHFEH